ncbi:MAG: hypothetical protein HND52_09105 [Ignavibacteriae bacterium]|nr:hypothetical protein [Ignavibacteriota bacterium]NOG98107.1 hypothetical protein [Ignavibacteriota bacterium]
MNNLKTFIFLTEEGYTDAPNYELNNTAIENLQVIGWSKGKNSDEAFKILIEENNYLLTTEFDKIFSLQLRNGIEEREYYYLSEQGSEFIN